MFISKKTFYASVLLLIIIVLLLPGLGHAMDDNDGDFLNSGTNSLKRKNHPSSNSSDSSDSSDSYDSEDEAYIPHHIAKMKQSTLENFLELASVGLEQAKAYSRNFFGVDRDIFVGPFCNVFDVWKFAFAPEREWNPTLQNYKSVLEALMDMHIAEDDEYFFVSEQIRDLGIQIAAKSNELCGYPLVFSIPWKEGLENNPQGYIEGIENACNYALQPDNSQHITLGQYRYATDVLLSFSLEVEDPLLKERYDKVEADLYYCLSQHIMKFGLSSDELSFPTRMEGLSIVSGNLSYGHGLGAHLRLVQSTKDSSVKQKYIKQALELAEKVNLYPDDFMNQRYFAAEIILLMGDAATDLSDKARYYTRSANLYNELVAAGQEGEDKINVVIANQKAAMILAEQKSAEKMANPNAPKDTDEQIRQLSSLRLSYLESGIRYAEHHSGKFINEDYPCVAQLSEEAFELTTSEKKRKYAAKALVYAVKRESPEQPITKEGFRVLLNMLVKLPTAQ